MSRYRLNPTPAQEAVLQDHCGHARYVWNLAVEQHAFLSATAINFIRADAWLNGTPLGTTRVSHLARLDLAA